MICWSCEREGGSGVTCGACGALLPPERGADRFSVLGLPARYVVDLTAAEAAYKRLSRQVHPDRFATGDARARRAALERTVQLNDAWRTIKDPVRRAEYMLERAGVKVGTDAASPAFLMEMFELREQLAQARMAGAAVQVAAMTDDIRRRAADAMRAIAAALDGARYEDAAQALAALRYHRRFLDEVAVHADGASAAGAV